MHALSLRKIENFVAKLDPQIHTGVQIVELSSGEPVFAHNPQQLFVPASTTKLLTAATALHFLHPDFQFSTKLFFDGNLYLKGSGDPSLTRSDLSELFAQAYEKGIVTIQGDLIIDITDFDTNWYAPGNCIDNIDSVWLRPVSGLMVDRCAVTGHVTGLCPETATCSLNAIGKLLEQAGIELNGTMRLARTSQNAKLVAQHDSAPLQELLAHMLQTSDNLYADCIVKRIGATAHGEPGSWESGTKSTQNFIRDFLELDPDQIVIKDGSGMSRYNAISPDFFTQLLAAMYEHQYSQCFIDCLAQSGISGTLKDRMGSIPGIVKAKTGTLWGISTLAGYVTDANGTSYAFSILTNGAPTQQATQSCKSGVEDPLCVIMATT
jgi:D-alanyl-D-alanine carboxypeptidase/D-alanyl-D-alanine-endopeptidase (penicillin-binding protein 4)